MSQIWLLATIGSLHFPSHRNWPTFPQVYINGELVGGADIMLELHKSGELVSELERIGHRSLLADENSPS